MSGEFYEGLTLETRHKVLSYLFDVWVKTQSPDTVKVIKKTLKHVSCTNYRYTYHLKRLYMVRLNEAYMLIQNCQQLLLNST